MKIMNLRRRYRDRDRIEERRDIYRHARELAIWNSDKFKEWERQFGAAYTANRNAALRSTLRRGDPPKDREVIPWSPYNG